MPTLAAFLVALEALQRKMPVPITSSQLLVSLIVLPVLFILSYFFFFRRRPSPLRVSRLMIFPIKSCAGIEISTSHPFNRLGFLYDRNFVLIDSNEAFRTQREFPRLALVKPEIDEKRKFLVLRAEGMKEKLEIPLEPKKSEVKTANVRVWDDSIEALIYENPVISAWLTNFLGAPCRIAKILSTAEHFRPLDPQYDFTPPENSISGAFHDGYPFLVAREESLAALNKLTAPQRHLTMEIFRPNIIIAGDAGKNGENFPAWDEDYWRLLEISSPTNEKPAILLRNAKLCSRCIIPNVQPETGERDSSGEPLLTLRKYRTLDESQTKPGESPPVYFGINCEQLTEPEGRISIGDYIQIIQRKTTLHEKSGKTEKKKKEEKK